MAEYTDKDIVHLKGIEAVRKRPGMYVGDVTAESGLFQVIKEAVDNSVDEYLAGCCKNICVTLNLDSREITVVDDGRGIPQKSLQTVFGELHSGSKFSDKIYSVSSGLHGLGVSCTNALADSFECFSTRKGKTVWIHYCKGELVKGPLKKKVPKELRISPTHGTTLRFTPDHTILRRKELPYKKIVTWFSSLSVLCPGLKFHLIIITPKGKQVKKIFYSKKGLAGNVVKGDLHTQTDTLDIWIRPLTEDSKVEGYVNTMAVREGSHLKAFWRAYKASLTPYAKRIPKQESLKEGVKGILHIRAKDPLYIGQTKEILGDARIEKAVYIELKGIFDVFFKKHQPLARRIIKQGMEIELLTKEHAGKLKALKSIEKDVKKGKLPLSLAVSYTKKIEERELFLTEGESAGGTAKAARDRHYQEILPLKGKILNTTRAKPNKILKSVEVQNIITSIGGIDPLKGRVGKVIILADADQDGKHITALISTLFLHTLTPWIKEGKVYVVIGPLFHTIYKDKRYFGNTADEVLDQTKGKCNVMRVKGWGEMKPDDLEYIAFNPQTRMLQRIEYSRQRGKIALSIMGESSAARKKLLGIE